jgi:cell wall assembly regulator SMI1
MTPQIRDIEPPVSAAQLKAAEHALGVRLPAAYRAFLLQHNGGQPVPDRFRLADGSGPESVAWFLAVHEREDGLVSLAATYRPYLHADLLPIASDPFGNLVCIGTQGGNEGKVYFWLHESEPPPGEALPHAGCKLVAASFAAFLNAFEPA